ncbi:MAG TPA: preprotein translocase subunit SecA [Candidatus Binatia bacterium]|nr:preprotein translocase subunit SecA [Candidatus Binatia bacterium]
MFDRRADLKISRRGYAEQAQPRTKWLDRAIARVSGPIARRLCARHAKDSLFVQQVAGFGSWASGLGDGEFREAGLSLSEGLRRGRFAALTVAQAFALVREAATRTLGQRHFDVQLIGGRVLLDGMVAEMATGEGKTLTATLAACTAALAGIPVHIVTVNDYLAARDAQWMGPIYDALGLSVATIVHGMDADARRAAYAADVTYCTNKEIAFDYLKDRIVLGREANRLQLQVERLYEERPRLKQLLLRGLHYAIVDEADSVLIDEAKTPLIISGAGSAETSEQETYQSALTLAKELEHNRDFVIEGRERVIRLLPAGLDRLAERAKTLGGVWVRRQWREELARQALSASHLFLKDKQYLVKDGKVQIIDEYTGRVMPDRSWEHGLHQMVEAKEGCVVTRRIDPLARISYQRFFRRYLRLAGMTGTAREVAAELWSVYRLATVTIPTNRPLKRSGLATRVYPSADKKWHAILSSIQEQQNAGRPVLVGTRSVAASEHLSRLLTGRGLDHQVLNARQDRQEAEIIARAGERCRITVATNMAGRGTDIRLPQSSRSIGGLHVIATELHEARRIDRQLFGRCGRQGDPGSYQAIISLEDELVRIYAHRWWQKLSALLPRLGDGANDWARAVTLALAQRAAERLHYRMRRQLLKMDEQRDAALAFSGRSE